MNHHVNHPEDEYYCLDIFMGTEYLDTTHLFPPSSTTDENKKNGDEFDKTNIS